MRAHHTEQHHPTRSHHALARSIGWAHCFLMKFRRGNLSEIVHSCMVHGHKWSHIGSPRGYDLEWFAYTISDLVNHEFEKKTCLTHV